MKDLYAENYKTLMKEIKQDKTNVKISCSWIRRCNTVKMFILSKTIFFLIRFNAILSKSKGYFS